MQRGEDQGHAARPESMHYGCTRDVLWLHYSFTMALLQKAENVHPIYSFQRKSHSFCPDAPELGLIANSVSRILALSSHSVRVSVCAQA